MGRMIAFMYGSAAYAFFFVTFLYAMGFMTGWIVPKAIDAGPVMPSLQALSVDVFLMSLFAVQHSVMARRGFKQWWTRIVPKAVERSTYVLLSSGALALLFWQWRPLPGIIWDLGASSLARLVLGLSFAGWSLVLCSTFLISHFELFGLHQVTNNLTGRPMPQVRFRTPMVYRLVRHPIYLGFIVAFWAAPRMSAGHLLFASVTTSYIILGTLLEERDLVHLFGEEYRRYQARVSMLIPWRKAA